MTNAGLNSGLPEVRELARRLDLALHERKLLDHITRTRSNSFALGSITLSCPPPKLFGDFQTMLDRQSKLVSDYFGPLAINDLPMFFATAIDNTSRDYTVLQGMLDTITYITIKSGFWPRLRGIPRPRHILHVRRNSQARHA